MKTVAKELIVFPNNYLSIPICQSQQTSRYVYTLSSAAINKMSYFLASCHEGLCKLELADEIEEASSYTFYCQVFVFLLLAIKIKATILKCRF